MAELERRKRQRFKDSLPVTLLGREGWERPGSTKDISSAGAYIFTNCGEIGEGSRVDLVLELPAEVTLTTAAKVKCHARVVRVDRTEAGVSGLALEIDAYDFLRTASSLQDVREQSAGS